MSSNHRRTQEEISEGIGPIARYVRKERKLLGYSQADFAERCGVGLRFLKDLELGKKTVRLDKVNQVLGYFGAEAVPAAISAIIDEDD